MTIDTSKLGWPVAAVFAAVFAATALSGFQANTAPKFAVVDIEKVFNESKLRETNQKTLNDARQARVTAINFIAQNAAMNNLDAKKYADLAVKTAPTPAETAELARLKTGGEDATRKMRELQTKPTLSDDEKKAVADFGVQTQGKQALLAGIEADYQSSFQELQGDLRDKTLDRVTDIVRGMAAKQGYTVVFNASAVSYAANDLTTEAMKAVK